MVLSRFSLFVACFFVVIALAIGVAFDRYVLRRDYLIQMRVDCDPAVERCFVGVCDPEAGEDCSEGSTGEETFYYAIALRNAQSLPGCELNTADCTLGACREGETECQMQFCSTEAVESEEECSSPEAFTTEPIEKDVVSDEAKASGEVLIKAAPENAEDKASQGNTDQ
jgi:hypothetical protein